MRPSAGRKRNVAAGCFMALAVVAARAVGAEARSVRIEYDAAAGCPDQGAFEAQLRARSAKIAITADGTTSVRVRIAQRGARYEGEVALVDPKGRESRRRVEGGCGDVTAALALITALALDPTASTASDPAAASALLSATAPSATASAPPPTPPSPPPPAPVPTIEPPAKQSAPGSDSQPLREDQARTHSWGWSVGAGAGFTQGVAPGTVVSVPAFLDVWRRSDGVFAPEVRVRFEHADSATAAVAGAGADFAWNAASLDLCPIAWSPWRVRLTPCVRAEGGVLYATGADVAPVRSDSRPWFTVGLVARARIPVVGALFLEVEGGAYAPIVRDRFFVEPNATVQQAPIVAAAGGAGGGVTFW